MLTYSTDKPKWSVWLNVPTVSVEEAVALSCGFNPVELRDNAERMVKASTIVFYPNFEERLMTAQRNMEPGGPLTVHLIGDQRRLALREFSLWAIGLGWGMPPQLSKLADEQPKPAIGRIDDPRSLRTYQKMILGMAMAKYRYDPDAKKNDAPVLISRALGEKGLAVGDDTVAKRLREAADALEDDLRQVKEQR